MKFSRKNIYLLILVLFSGLAAPFYSSLYGMIFLFGISLYMMDSFRLGISINLKKAIIVWLSFSVIVFIAQRVFTPMFIFRHIVFIFTAYVTVSLFREQLFHKLESILYFFASVSLFFWAWQLISLDTITEFGRLIGVYVSDGDNKKEYSNFILYTINYGRYAPALIPRNAGFCWEPGPFANFLSIAIMINFFRNNFKIVLSRKLIILFVTLLTTASTAGILAVGTLVLYSASFGYRGLKKYLLISAFGAIFIYLFFTVDFLYNKIETLYNSGIDVKHTSINRANELNKFSSGGRFGGMVLAWQDLKRSPLWGTGGASEFVYGNLGGAGVFIVSGLGRIMSTYGLFGICIYLIFVLKSSRRISGIYNSKATVAFLIIILVCSFSTSLHRQIIPFTLIFYSLFDHSLKVKFLKLKHKII
jgi:hypothetical protein